MIFLFNEPGFPTLDASPLPLAGLKKALSGAGPISVHGLDRLAHLDPAKIHLLVLANGSAFPLEAWASIHRYLEGGGNLLLLGGRPFEVPVVRDGKKWSAQGRQTAYHQSLGLEQINLVPAKRSARHQASPDLPLLEGLTLPPRDSHSLMVRMTEVDEEARCGAVGPMDSELTPLLWGLDASGRRVACPVVQWDRHQGRFEGGRWVFAASDLPPWNGALEQMVARLALRAKAGSLQVALRPSLACYAPGAQPDLNLWVRGHSRRDRKVQVDFQVSLEGEKVHARSLRAQVGRASHYQALSLPLAVEPGFYGIRADVSVDGKYSHTLRQGFWGWDETLVQGAPALSVKGTRFLKDGKTLPVVGTTYMAGDVSRKFLTIPNPAVWDQDMGEMAADGINWVRTGLWANHRQFLLDSGAPREDALRALDAYVLTTLKHGLLLTFNFFSFSPDNWPSDHPYLDPRALSIQREYMLSMVRRYSRIPSLSWDFINEPSVSDPARLWKTRPLYNRLERDAFREYLRRRHGNLDALREKWNETPEELGDWDHAELLPSEGDFEEPLAPQEGLIRAGRAYDFNRYAQGVFADWVRGHREVLGEATRQLFCVGQDEGGVSHRRPNNHLYHGPLDFTCNHTWWETEDLVSGVTSARVKGKPFLAQETGIMFTDGVGREKRRSEEEAGRLFERKLAAAFMGGAGFLQWCWNVNAYMNNRNEVEIGAWRPDRTARPEALIMASFGDFFRKAAEFLQEEPEEASLAVVESLSGLLSLKSPTAVSQRMAHRVLAALRIPFHTLAEHEYDRLTGEKAVLFPSVKRLDAPFLSGWLKAAAGRDLLVSGPLAQDGWGRPTEGLSDFGVRERRTEVRPEEILSLKGGSQNLSYSAQKTNWTDKDAGLPGRIHRLARKKSSLLYVPLPVESNDSREAVAALYREWAAAAGLKPYCTMEGSSDWEVTVLPRRFAKGALYAAFNEGSQDRTVRLRDLKFGFKAALFVPAGRAALAVFDAKGKALVSYRNPDF